MHSLYKKQYGNSCSELFDAYDYSFSNRLVPIAMHMLDNEVRKRAMEEQVI
jgi:hypothetical protein